MANFYTEHPELKYHLNNPMMERICQLKERDYRDKDEYDYAPQDYADAIDSYDKVLEITGEITAGNFGNVYFYPPIRHVRAYQRSTALDFKRKFNVRTTNGRKR